MGYKMKTCLISGKRFKATKDNFYFNANSSDRLHPYHKKYDNFRRTTGATKEQLQRMFNQVNQYV